ncbi:MAG: HD domain-containing protein [Dehalococcoidia bacterium]|nr:HD domain-containing protein [Dehalococcoidia bacterium]
MDDRELRARMAPELPEGLLAHIDRVVEIADALARRHGLDVPRTRLAAQGHDLLRGLDDAEWLARAQARGWDIDPVEQAEPVLLHGPLGAEELCERFGVTDEQVLHAIRWHTPGHPDYTRESWAMFLADKVDPRKVERWPALAEVAERAEKSLEDAALAYLDLTLARAIEAGWQIHPMATLTRNALLRRR